MSLNDRNIFLLDGIGAAMSAAATGIMLPLFSDQIGMPTLQLQLLGLIGLVLVGYSLNCYFVIKRTTSRMLLAIIVANSIYAALAVFIAFRVSTLTTLGQAYFFTEALIIGGIILLETRIYRQVLARTKR